MNTTNTDRQEPFFTRMRRAAEETLDRDVTTKEAADFAGVNERTWLRYEHGDKTPTPSIIRHFWMQVHREAVEMHRIADEHDDVIGDYFADVDTDVKRWMPARYK